MSDPTPERVIARAVPDVLHRAELDEGFTMIDAADVILEALAAHRMTVATLPEADKVTNFSVRLCLANGWGVGTRLAGDEGHGETVIEITYMSERTLLAKMISDSGQVVAPAARPQLVPVAESLGVA